MTEYTDRELAIREDAFEEAFHLVRGVSDDLADGVEGYVQGWRTESAVAATSYAAEIVRSKARWARAEIEARADSRELND